MSSPTENPYDALSRTFHEPKRLAIVSSLCSAPQGLTFTELRDLGDLTDGNLSRHLKTLETDGVVRIEKAFVGVKPQTTAYLTEAGRDGFMAYLQALESVLKRAATALEDSPAAASDPAWGGRTTPA